MSDELPYQLVWSRKAQNELEDLRNKADDSRQRNALDSLVLAINKQLRSRPLSLGTIYRSAGAIDEHIFANESLVIDFAVDVQRQFVLVRSCWAASAGNRNDETKDP
jgi:hypothetical protein